MLVAAITAISAPTSLANMKVLWRKLFKETPEAAAEQLIALGAQQAAAQLATWDDALQDTAVDQLAKSQEGLAFVTEMTAVSPAAVAATPAAAAAAPAAAEPPKKKRGTNLSTEQKASHSPWCSQCMNCADCPLASGASTQPPTTLTGRLLLQDKVLKFVLKLILQQRDIAVGEDGTSLCSFSKLFSGESDPQIVAPKFLEKKAFKGADVQEVAKQIKL